MKKTALSAILLVGLLAFLAPSPAKGYVSVSISVFQHELAPYGEWVVTSRYGHCWRPRVARHWRPYYNGHWVWTDYGWTWVSYDPWGGDPFHYGTWVWVDDNYGWCWEPGYVWSPAWVTWSYTDDYIGWAPVPATFDIGVTGYVGSPVVVAQSNYVFVPMSGFVGSNVSTVAVAPTENATFLARGRNVTNFSVSGGVVHTGGPPQSVIERASGKTVSKMSLASISGHAIKPAAIAGAGLVAGRKMSVTAPASDRASVAKMAKAGGPAGGPKGMAGGSKAMKPAMAEAKPSKGMAAAKPSKGFANEAKPSKAAHGGPPSAKGMKSAPAPKHAERTAAPSHTKVMAPQHQAAPRAVERHAAPAPRAQAAPQTHLARHEAPAPRMVAPAIAGPPPREAGPAPHGGPPPQAVKPEGGGGGPKGGGGGEKPKKEKG